MPSPLLLALMPRLAVACKGLRGVAGASSAPAGLLLACNAFFTA